MSSRGPSRPGSPRPRPKSPGDSMRKPLLLLALLALSCGGPGRESTGAAPSPEKNEAAAVADAKVKDVVEEALKLGAIKFKDSISVYIKPALWEGMNAEQKEGFCKSAAYYNQHYLGNQNAIYVYDWQTGRKLAYKGAWGIDLF